MLQDDSADKAIEKREAKGVTDRLALALTTFGVGYIPAAPGTYGSAVGVAVYLGVMGLETLAGSSGSGAGINLHFAMVLISIFHSAFNSLALTGFCLLGIWASGRTATIFGRKDPSQAVVDEVMGQLITFCFVPFGIPWPFILAGFLLFRVFDIWKPFPIRTLEVLPSGLGICADDIVAGVYAGVCLSVAHAVYLSI